jgi:hypothetical protein
VASSHNEQRNAGDRESSDSLASGELRRSIHIELTVRSPTAAHPRLSNSLKTRRGRCSVKRLVRERIGDGPPHLCVSPGLREASELLKRLH